MGRFFGLVIAGCCVVIAVAATYLALHVAATTATEANARLFSDFARLRIEAGHGLTEASLHEVAVQAQIDAQTAAWRHQMPKHGLEAVNTDLDRIFAAEEVWRQLGSSSRGCRVDVISGASYIRESRFCLQLLKPLFDKMNAKEPDYEDYLAVEKIIQPALNVVTAATDDALSRL